MLQSFMRPVMLVFGFIVASKMTDVMGGYLMSIYPMVVANIQMSSLTGFLSIIMLVAIFLMLSISIINSCMSIMYILPEAMWTFMGAHSSQTTQTGRNMEQSVAGVAKTSSIAAVAGPKGSGSIGAKLGVTNKRLVEKEKEAKKDQKNNQSGQSGKGGR